MPITRTHMHTYSLTCQPVPEVGQADLLGAIEEQGALWVQKSHLRQQTLRSGHATLPHPSPAPGVLAGPHLLEWHRLDPFCFPHVKHIDGVLTEQRQVGGCITYRMEAACAVQPWANGALLWACLLLSTTGNTLCPVTAQ